MILTADEHLRDEARIYRDQGKASFLGGGHVRLGSAWRMSEVQAAVAMVHLEQLDEFIGVRRAVAARYDDAFAGNPHLPRAVRAGRVPQQLLQVRGAPRSGH